MVDTLSREKRSWNMSRIKGKDTSLEVKVRSYLFNQGFRFRKNVNQLPGKPDIVLSKYRTVIFINGCFWHHHKGCRFAVIPKTRTDFWLEKFQKNTFNDKKNEAILKKLGWRVVIAWECELKNDFFGQMTKIIKLLRS